MKGDFAHHPQIWKRAFHITRRHESFAHHSQTWKGGLHITLRHERGFCTSPSYLTRMICTFTPPLAVRGLCTPSSESLTYHPPTWQNVCTTSSDNYKSGLCRCSSRSPAHISPSYLTECFFHIVGSYKRGTLHTTLRLNCVNLNLNT